MKKKSQLVALPADNGSKLWLNGDGSGWTLQNQEGYNSTRIKGAHHLYLLSEDEIKEGDWYINIPTNKLEHKKSNVIQKGGFPYGRIVATTNPDLWKEKVYGYRDNKWGEIPTGIWKVPTSLIEVFVKLQGLIKEVFIEYDEREMVYYELGCYKPKDLPKLTSNGEIIWSPVEKKMYTREEVMTIAGHAHGHGYALCLGVTNDLLDFEDWFNKNYPE
jgi:hypothetical protein